MKQIANEIKQATLSSLVVIVALILVAVVAGCEITGDRPSLTEQQTKDAIALIETITDVSIDEMSKSDQDKAQRACATLRLGAIFGRVPDTIGNVDWRTVCDSIVP